MESLPGIKNQVKREANNDDLQILQLTKKTPVKEMDYKDNSNVKSVFTHRKFSIKIIVMHSLHLETVALLLAITKLRCIMIKIH